MASTRPTATVIVVTLNRPDCVRRCLTCLVEQEPQPDQTIVVDASNGNETEQVVGQFPGVLYLRNPNGYGRMTASRNIGLLQSTCQIISFIDDDAFPRPGWLANLLDTYADAGGNVGAVGGRACNGQPGEAEQGVDEIGRLYPDGRMTGNFAADPGKVIEVDHVMGCNMSYRRAVIARLGGFREDYPGISGVREDSDFCLRVGRLGYRVLFNPAAVVDHIGAPQAKGKRFDWRYEFYIQRNHLTLLVRNYGPTSGILWKYLAGSAVRETATLAKRVGGAVLKAAAIGVGTVVGAASGLRRLASTGNAPERNDPAARKVREALERGPA